VKILRSGRIPLPNVQTQKSIFNRLLQIFCASDACAKLVEFRNLDPDHVTVQVIANELLPTPPGVPQHTIVHPDHFLMHLLPDPTNQRHRDLHWEGTWNWIKDKYAWGLI